MEKQTPTPKYKWINTHVIIVLMIIGIITAATGFLFSLSGTFPHPVIASTTIDYPGLPKLTHDGSKLVERGAYLVRAGDCIACHTRPGGEPFAGGLPIITPFGTIFSPNITPDKETGIGDWSDDDFVRAVREGISPHGSFYFPVFPFPYFNKMSRDDVLAMKAYLDRVPPVKNQDMSPHMPIPFRWRFMQMGWRILYFYPDRGEFKPDPSKSKQWNRGAYLVNGPGHCSMCHTPLNFLGAPQKQYFLTGGFVDGFYAPNITSTRLQKVTEKQVVSVFTKDHRIDGGRISATPMLEVNHDSLRYMTRSDLDAIVTYLKSVRSETPPHPTSSGKVTAATGKKLYDKYCMACHANGAGGAPITGDSAEWSKRMEAGKNKIYRLAISGIGGMPPKGGCVTCSNLEIQAAVDYILDQSKASVKVVETPEVAPLPKPTLALGKDIYTKSCAICHDDGKGNAQKIGDTKEWAPILEKNMDVLIMNTIKGYKTMPARGGCHDCSDTDIIAAVKYLVQASKSEGNYKLW